MLGNLMMVLGNDAGLVCIKNNYTFLAFYSLMKNVFVNLTRSINVIL